MKEIEQFYKLVEIQSIVEDIRAGTNDAARVLYHAWRLKYSTCKTRLQKIMEANVDPLLMAHLFMDYVKNNDPMSAISLIIDESFYDSPAV